MKSEWAEEPVGRLIGYMSKGLSPVYTDNVGENTIYVLNQKCNREYLISYELARLHDMTTKAVPPEKLLRKNDILINSTGTGTAGRVAQLIDVHKPTTFVGASYLEFALKAQQESIIQLAEGSTGQTELNRQRLCNEIFVRYPKDKKSQTIIADLLSAFDALIATNKKINDYLEQAVITIYKSCFVYFEPLIVRLGDVCPCVLGGTPSRAKPEYWGGAIAWINSGKVNTFRIIEPNEMITEIGLNNCRRQIAVI